MLFENGHQDVNRHGCPDLRLHRVFRSAIEGLDPQMLFDPAKEQLDAPAGLVKLRDRQGGEREIIGEKYKTAMMFFIEVTNPSRWQRIVLSRIDSGEDDRLIGTADRCSCRLDASSGAGTADSSAFA